MYTVIAEAVAETEGAAGGLYLFAAIGLMLFAVALFFVEVFLPSFGLFSLVALASIGGSVYSAYQYSSAAGPVFAVINVAAIPVVVIFAFKLLPRSPFVLRSDVGLDKNAVPEPANETEEELVGKEGVAKTQLRPSGIAEIDGRRMDVVTEGGLVEPGTRVKVVKTRGNRIVVRSV